MKKSTKKKILTLALVLALLAIVTVGGSLAWFTAEDIATNTFTVGSIRIEQHESQLGPDGNPEEFEQGKVLLPIVNVDNPAEDPNYQDKIVTIENTGNNPAYVRTFIAFPANLETEYLMLDYETSDDPANGWTWENRSVITYAGESYVVYCFVYGPQLEKGATTPELLKGVYLRPMVDLKNNPATEGDNLEFCIPYGDGSYKFSGYEIATADGKAIVLEDGSTKTVNVLVLTQAVQAEGFSSAGEALDAAFGELKYSYDPFNVNN